MEYGPCSMRYNCTTGNLGDRILVEHRWVERFRGVMLNSRTGKQYRKSGISKGVPLSGTIKNGTEYTQVLLKVASRSENGNREPSQLVRANESA